MRAMLAAMLVLGGLPAWAGTGIDPATSFIDSVTFGRADSEQSHGFAEANTLVATGGLGTPCRRIGPHGHLTFVLECRPGEQNYLTVKLWGSDTGRSQLYLYRNDERLGGYQQDWPELDLLTAEPFFPGRFCYTTYMIPLEWTRQKRTVSICIGSAGRPTPYSPATKEARQEDLSRGVYRACIGVDPFFVPGADDKQGRPPLPAEPRSHPTGLCQIEYLYRQLDLAVDRMLTWQYYGPEWDRWVSQGKAPGVMTGSINIRGAKDAQWTRKQWKDVSVRRGGIHVRCQLVPEIYARAYHAKWSRHFHDGQLVGRVIKALDFYRIAQGSDGGFVEIEDRRQPGWIGGPDRKPGNGCLMGFGMMGLPAAFLLLEKEIASGSLLKQTIDDDDNVETSEVPRGQAYADLFVGMRDYLVSSRGRGHAPNQDMADILAASLCDRCLRRLRPAQAWSDQDLKRYVDAACGLDKDIYGGYWISRKGLSLEPHGSSNGGYCGNYGPSVIDPLFRLATLTRDDRIGDRASQAAHALAKFLYPSLDAEGRPCIRLEGVITWRNNFTPGRIAYGGNPHAAVTMEDPLCLRQIQLTAAHGGYFRVKLDQYWVHLQSTTVNLLQHVDQIEQALALPPTERRLPFEDGQPDFAWADEQAGAVVVKHGDERLVMSLNWRHGFKTRERAPANAVANDIARVHHRTPKIARIANVRMETVGGIGGLYVCRYGNYLTVMNASARPRRFELGEWANRPVSELIRRKRYTAATIQVPAMDTVVLRGSVR